MTAATDELMPVQEALLRGARADAARTLAEAETSAQDRIAEAERVADEILAEARGQGERDAATALAAERARARRTAHGIVLSAQREIYDKLRSSAVAAVRAILLSGDHALRDTMCSRVRTELGPDAAITELPGGGVLGQAPGRRVAYTAEALTDAALGRLSGRLSELWTS
ncbi:hypothetical protein [Kutzneria albida]|uniref:V-type ATP synthase subunit E n=1 Tax=Kutzneria albida DSM 43870 TaxID=1449976 RepID=W5W8P8_9PSEU|nr:hypothetical protein [Kutzneria albida]AHH97508.1 hypothetical protein KALB_4144 [Kutzneria albida DSM 43870]